MTKEDFCKLHTAFHGEEISDLKQLTFQGFTGEELFEFVSFIQRETIEIAKLEAIQKYLLEHGANDENVNDRIFELKGIKK